MRRQNGFKYFKALGVIGLGVVCAVIIARWTRSAISPWSQLPTDSVVVVVDESCKVSQALFRDFARVFPSPSTERYWFVPTRHDTAFALDVCKHTLARLDSWRTRNLPATVQCTFLGSDVREMLSKTGATGFPSLLEGGDLASFDRARVLRQELKAALKGENSAAR